MILIWRGWGLMAVVALLLPLAVCAGLLEGLPGLAFTLGGVALAAGGVVCIRYGRRWNREGTEHSLYFVPLQAWGWIYLAVGGLFTAGGVAAVIRKGGFGN